jgi:hypothetical protein
MRWTERCLIPYAMPAAKLEAACCVLEDIDVFEEVSDRCMKQAVGCQQSAEGDFQMFDVIDFLESVGQHAPLRYASSEDVAAVLAGQSIDDQLRDIILAKDAQALGVMLGKGPYCCYINPAEEEEGEEKKEKDDQDKDGKDGEGEVKKSSSKGPRK